jgi:PTH1 family peptidyl-tRNA hydrolase
VKVIFGLGNPGQKYKNNRHNIGYQVIDRLLAEHGLTTRRNFRLSAYIARKKDPSGWVFLVKPRTFMNNSGACVRKVLDKYKVVKSDALIIYDDTDLPWGSLRFRAGGSSAGHRGMASIIKALGSEEISRLRIGIGRASEKDLSEYVLSDFASQEREVLESIIREVSSASWEWVNNGIDFVMKKYNR